MPENPPDKEDLEKEDGQPAENSSASDDQKTRSYYYDDACGYEIYDADEDDEESSISD